MALAIETFFILTDLAGCAGIEGFKTILNDIWFGMYDRKAFHDTSGYDMTELAMLS